MQKTWNHRPWWFEEKKSWSWSHPPKPPPGHQLCARRCTRAAELGALRASISILLTLRSSLWSGVHAPFRLSESDARKPWNQGLGLGLELGFSCCHGRSPTSTFLPCIFLYFLPSHTWVSKECQQKTGNQANCGHIDSWYLAIFQHFSYWGRRLLSCGWSQIANPALHPWPDRWLTSDSLNRQKLDPFFLSFSSLLLCPGSLFLLLLSWP